MKKSVYLIGLAAALLTACSENDSFDGTDVNNEVAFETYVGKQTRATVTTIDNLNDFGVYAYVTPESAAQIQLMDNEKVSKSGSSWSYSNIKYWPENDKVNFYAYAPYNDVAISNYSSTANTFDYTVPVLSSAQKDLIGATAIQKSKDSNSGKVGLVFKHLLSRIGFNAKLSDSYGAKVTVTGLEVIYANGVDSKNTFTFTSTDDSNGTNEAGSWSATAGSQYTADANSGQLCTSSVEMTTTSQSLNTADTYLMLLPQSVAASDVQVKITYTVDYENPAATVTNEKVINLPATTWAMGKAYTYNFDISLTGIEFADITVDNWGDDSSQPAETPVP